MSSYFFAATPEPAKPEEDSLKQKPIFNKGHINYVKAAASSELNKAIEGIQKMYVKKEEKSQDSISTEYEAAIAAVYNYARIFKDDGLLAMMDKANYGSRLKNLHTLGQLYVELEAYFNPVPAVKPIQA